MWKVILVGSVGLDSLSRSVRRSTTTSDNLFLVTWIGLIIAFWVGLYYFDQWRKNRNGNSGNAKSLFSELSSAHHLTRHERSLLMKAVNDQPAIEPATVFVDPRILGKCVTSPQYDSESYASLSTKLFGTNE